MSAAFLPLQTQCAKAFGVWRDSLAKLDGAMNEAEVGINIENALRGIYVTGGVTPNSRAGVNSFRHRFKPHKARAVRLARHMTKMMLAVVDTYISGEDHTDPVTGLSTSAMIAEEQEKLKLKAARKKLIKLGPDEGDSDTYDSLKEDGFGSLISHINCASKCATRIAQALYKREFGQELPMNDMGGGDKMMAANCYNYPAAYGLLYPHSPIVKSGHNIILFALPEHRRRSAIQELVDAGKANEEDVERGYLSPRTAIVTTFRPTKMIDFGPQGSAPAPGKSETIH